MGEIAEMMLDGFLDEETGEVIDGDSPGYPRRMSGLYATGGNAPLSEAAQVKRRQKNKAKKARQKANRLARAAAPRD